MSMTGWIILGAVVLLLLYVMAAFQIIFFAWVYGIDRGWRELHEGASIRVPPIFKFIMKYVSPTYLIIVFLAFCFQNLGPSLRAAWANTGSKAGVLSIVATLVFLLVMARIGERRWRSQGLDIDDKNPAS